MASAPATFAARMCSSECRYPEISTVSSAERACREPRSSGATTATVPIPSARQVRKTRSAISPRFATSSLSIFIDAQRRSAVDDEAVQRPQQRARPAREAGKAEQAMRQRLAAFAPFELLGGDRLPQLVDDDVRRPADVVASEVLAPEAQPRLPGKCSVAGHDVQLGVVEERVLVQVRRPDRQPRVVD